MENKIKEVVEIIKKSKRTTAFTGAGISVESGIPPFRGDGGLWNKYDPIVLDLNYFYNNPKESWSVIKEIFYDFFGTAKFNRAHEVLAEMEKQNYLSAVITQNIDNLHQEAGSEVVHEFHGNSKTLVCTSCGKKYTVKDEIFKKLPPKCKECGHLLKPDFIFFGEGIPQIAYQKSIEASQNSDVFIVIGSTGEVVPASQMPFIAKQNGAKIIEINPNESKYTSQITDIFLQGKAGEVLDEVMSRLDKIS